MPAGEALKALPMVHMGRTLTENPGPRHAGGDAGAFSAPGAATGSSRTRRARPARPLQDPRRARTARPGRDRRRRSAVARSPSVRAGARPATVSRAIRPVRRVNGGHSADNLWPREDEGESMPRWTPELVQSRLDEAGLHILDERPIDHAMQWKLEEGPSVCLYS